MGSNIIELVKLGHERAAELKSSCGAVDVRSVAQLISDLATQLEVQLARGNAQAVQLANAESKCRELAAELHSVKSAHQDAVDTIMNTASKGVVIYTEKPIQMSVATPIHDAYLAEVRAQGVERYAEQLKSEADRAEETGWEDAAKFLRSESEKVLAFAAQLRK
ncbi:hypothetical protein [Citrobacter freundii]|uniref:hypothetical protein n=1 Tax=Citrobacter freundii TaxID=546 RepID=UPI000E1D2280|nr:hypothetical protein [Citrobacter freundii]RDT35833.1 hypothetical protein DXF86_22670 [Citrobacter freundii]